MGHETLLYDPFIAMHLFKGYLVQPNEKVILFTFVYFQEPAIIKAPVIPYNYNLPSLVSCGVASTTCQPPKPAGRSGLDM